MSADINNNAETQSQKLLGEAPKKGALSSLSQREKIMVIALIIIVLVGGIGYFVIMPALDKLTTLQEEIDSLETQQITIQNQIALKETFAQQLKDAKVDYEKYQTVFFPQMSPERIDEMITSAIHDCGLRPVSLTMSQIQTEPVPMFSPQMLEINSTSSGEEEVIEEEPVEGEEESAEGEEATEEEMEELPISTDGPYSFVYTVDITAAGGRENAYALLDTMLATDALKLISFQYTPPQDAINNASDILSGVPTQEATEGAVLMQVKLYAFLPGITPGPDSITTSAE